MYRKNVLEALSCIPQHVYVPFSHHISSQPFKMATPCTTMEKMSIVLLILLFQAGCIVPPSPEKVTIYRDMYGVPHIFAESDEGAFFGMGYVQAQDHLEAMMRNFAQATGRLSSREHGYVSDVMVNLLRIPDTAHEKYYTLSPQNSAKSYTID